MPNKSWIFFDFYGTLGQSRPPSNQPAPQFQLFANIQQILLALARDYLLFIVSSAPSATIKECLVYHHVEQTITAIIGGDSESNKTRAIKQLLQGHRGYADRSLMITDTIDDIKSAQALNIATIAVTWGSQNQATLDQSHPTRIINHIEQLLPTINQLLPGTT